MRGRAVDTTSKTEDGRRVDDGRQTRGDMGSPQLRLPRRGCGRRRCSSPVAFCGRYRAIVADGIDRRHAEKPVSGTNIVSFLRSRFGRRVAAAAIAVVAAVGCWKIVGPSSIEDGDERASGDGVTGCHERRGFRHRGTRRQRGEPRRSCLNSRAYLFPSLTLTRSVTSDRRSIVASCLRVRENEGRSSMQLSSQ